MLKRYFYKKAFKNYTQNLQKHHNSFVFLENSKDDQHNMLIEEEKFIEAKKDMPYPNAEEYFLLEKVDLIDYRRLYGRNKKRRGLLCRS